MPIVDYCRREVATIDMQETLRSAAERMVAENIGCLVVTERGRVRAIVTDRDLALRVLREGLDPSQVRLDAFVERGLVVVNAKRPVRLAIMLMRKYGVRRLPVLDDAAQLVGLVTWDDAVSLLAREIADVASTIATQAPRLPVPPSRALVDLASAGEAT
jgi:CBS domain-containing protein